MFWWYHIKDTISFSYSFTLDEVLSKVMCISSQLCPVLVTIDFKAIAKPWNVLMEDQASLKGPFSPKPWNQYNGMGLICREVSDPFHLLAGTASVLKSNLNQV